MHNVLSTPIQLIKNPPKRAPKTAAVFHVLVLQVAALGYTFLGTIKAISEKIIGPKKERKKPPKKINT